jgi:hypothetical protein
LPTQVTEGELSAHLVEQVKERIEALEREALEHKAEQHVVGELDILKPPPLEKGADAGAKAFELPCGKKRSSSRLPNVKRPPYLALKVGRPSTKNGASL